ncbi:MAG: glycosyltransferase family 2 protein [Gemmatimonadales bacterium]
MDLSIVVVSYNSWVDLEPCLEAIARTVALDHEVIVVDNASSDGTVARLGARFPGARVIANAANAGFARANNQGIEVSSGRDILLLNPDTEVGPGAVARMAEVLATQPRIGIVGCRLLNTDGTTQYSWRSQASLLWWAASRVLGLEGLVRSLHIRRMDAARRRAAAGEIIYVEEIMGACLMVRRAVVEDIGGLDERIFMSLEDSEFCRRAARAGWDVAYAGDVTVTHHGGRSARGNLGQALTEYYRSEMYFVRLYHGRVGAIVHRLLLVGECALKGTVTLVRVALGRSEERARLRAYRATLRSALTWGGPALSSGAR